MASFVLYHGISDCYTSKQVIPFLLCVETLEYCKIHVLRFIDLDQIKEGLTSLGVPYSVQQNCPTGSPSQDFDPIGLLRSVSSQRGL